MPNFSGWTWWGVLVFVIVVVVIVFAVKELFPVIVGPFT